MNSLILTSLLISIASAPAQAPAPSGSTSVAAPALDMTVKGGLLGTVTIEAKQVETKRIIERLKTEFKIPVEATALVSQHKVDLSLKGASTQALLAALAPVVLVDQEVALGQEPVWIGIHLAGLNEKEPAASLKRTGFLVFAGIPPEGGQVSSEELEARATEATRRSLDEPQTDNKPVLTVAVTADHRVSLIARQQPLIAILNEIAARATIPIDLRGEVDLGLIDIEIKDLPLREIGVALGRGGFRLLVRKNLGTGEERVQGILVGDPTKPIGQ